MTLYIALPHAALSDTVTDFEAARRQAKEMVDQHGKTIGTVVVLRVTELGRFEYASPIWVEADEPSPFGSREEDLGKPKYTSTSDQGNSRGPESSLPAWASEDYQRDNLQD